MFGPFEIYSEKISGGGEDAPPLRVELPQLGVTIGAVFDGVGGAGGTLWAERDGTVTGARLASRLARDALAVALTNCATASDAFESAPTLPNLDAVFSNVTVAALFDERFSAARSQLVAVTEGRIRSKMIKALPTTFAGFACAEHGPSVLIRTLWAGDSRVYFLSHRGLQQLMIDHVRSRPGDLVKEGGDAPLTNLISETTPNQIEARDHVFDEPGFVIAATDGVYGYFSTIAHLEDSLWTAILSDAEADLPERILHDAVVKVAQDDASAVLVPVGWQSAGRTLDAIAARARHIRNAVADIDQHDCYLADLEQNRIALQNERSALIESVKVEPPAKPAPKTDKAAP